LTPSGSVDAVENEWRTAGMAKAGKMVSQFEMEIFNAA